MHAFRAGRLRIRRHAERRQCVTNDERRGANVVERCRRHRIEVEVQVIGAVDVVAARVPRIEIDAAEVDEPKERREILHDRKGNDIARSMRDRARFDPRGTRFRRALHEEPLAGGAVRIALHDHRAVREMRQQRVGDRRVIAKQVGLHEPERRPERLPQVRQVHVATVDRDRRPVGVVGYDDRHARVVFHGCRDFHTEDCAPNAQAAPCGRSLQKSAHARLERHGLLY